MRVVAEARTGREAVAPAGKHRPDVVLMDLRMPDDSGIEATHAIRADATLAATRILVLTAFGDLRASGRPPRLAQLGRHGTCPRIAGGEPHLVEVADHDGV
ncbi:hypothetical protein GCM10011490_01120 [Pseudoclavibacter endophyticus]|nr:hypothetical protein GCM10011490_01120 [Pseudoclavibacter endophyticus]